MKQSYNPSIYINNIENSCRFVLGIEGENPLIVFGINPSYADDKIPDRTINRVRGFSRSNGFDGFIMLNIYPQRSTNPNNLDVELNTVIHNTNLTQISLIFQKYQNPTILAAWSEKIDIRKYLQICLIEIYKLSLPYKANWVKIGEFTKSGHPRHPLYASGTLPLTKFDIDSYIAKNS